jgi:hypothetical protein
MTRITVGRTVNPRSEEERIHIDLTDSQLNPDEARTLVERVEEQLTLLEGGTATPDTPATDEIDVDGHAPGEMMGSSEYHTQQDGDGGDGSNDDVQEGADATGNVKDDVGMVACTECERTFDTERGLKIHRVRSHSGDDDPAEPDGDDAVPDPTEARARGLDDLVAVDQVGEKMVGSLREEGFETISDVFDASVTEIARANGIGHGTASRVHDHCADVIHGEPDAGSDEQSGESATSSETSDDEGADDAVEDTSNGTEPDGDGIEPLPAGDIESALVECDVDHEVGVSDVIQAVDEYSACFRVGRMLGIDWPTAEVLIGRLDLKPALEREDGLAARRVQLADGGEPA